METEAVPAAAGESVATAPFAAGAEEQSAQLLLDPRPAQEEEEHQQKTQTENAQSTTQHTTTKVHNTVCGCFYSID